MALRLCDFNDDLFSKKNKINGIIRNSRLTPMINEPTRMTSTTATALDVIINNRPESVLATSVVPAPATHRDLIGITINIKKTERA